MRSLRSRRFDPEETDPLLLRRDAFGSLTSEPATPADEHPRNRQRPELVGLAAVLTVGGLWVLLNLRYGYHLEDSVLYLTLAKQQLSPALYPDNPLIEHLRRMPYPLYKSMGSLLGTPLGLNAHVAATVAMRFAFVAVLFWFMTVLTGRRWAGALAALASILQPAFYGTLAWTELISPEFVQSDLGKMVLMAGLAAYLRGRPILTALILGVGFNIHPIFSVATAVMIAPDAICRWRQFGTWRMRVAAAIGVLLAAPTAIGTIRSLSLSVASPGHDHVELIRFFNYFHVFPSLFHRWEYVWFFGLSGAGVVAFAMLASRLGERRSAFLRLALGIALWLGVGVVFVEWAPHALALQMMPFRLTYAVRLLATGLVIAAALDVMRHREPRSFVLVALWLATAMVSVKYMPWVTVLVAAWLLARRRDRWSVLAMVAAIGSAGMVAWIDPDQLPSLGNVPWAAVFVLTAGLIVLRLEQKKTAPGGQAPSDWDWPFSSAGRIGWVAVIVAAGMVTVAKTADGVRQPKLAAKPWLSPTGHDLGQDAWQDVMAWARTHTGPDACFLTPPDQFSWTYYSERNTLISYQLGMQSVWDRRYAPEARRRLDDIGGAKPWAPGPNYHAFSPGRLAAIAWDYGVSYIVWKKAETNRMSWPVVYENGEFLVYDVRKLLADSFPKRVADADRPTAPATGDPNP